MASHKNGPPQSVLSEIRQYVEPAGGYLLGLLDFKGDQSRKQDERQLRLVQSREGRRSAHSGHPPLYSPSQNKCWAGHLCPRPSPHIPQLCVCALCWAFTCAPTSRSLLLLVIYRGHQKPRHPTQPLVNQGPSL